MIRLKRIFVAKNYDDMRGGMLVELLLSVALAAIVLPFVFQYQTRAVRRAENIVVMRQMQTIQSALERYIADNRTRLLNTVGKNITRVELSDLYEYGVSSDVINSGADKYQLRILKSRTSQSGPTLQGVVVLNDDEITPLRTREIVQLSGGDMGFVDGARAYGTFGAWQADTIDLGVTSHGGIIETTSVNRDNALYLWRVPSDVASDATMLSGLSLGGHDIMNVSSFNAATAEFNEVLAIGATAARTSIFKNRTTIDKEFQSSTVTVAGGMSSDSKTLEVSNTLRLSDTGKFTNFTADDLWVTNLTLSGLSVSDTSTISILKVNDALDMTAGRIDAMYVTVSFTGSVTPRLEVHNRIEDSVNPSYYWDAGSSSNRANFADASFVELTRMAPLAVRYSGAGRATSASQIFDAVAANKNATVSDFMNAITEIQEKVRTKYRRLNLQ